MSIIGRLYDMWIWSDLATVLCQAGDDYFFFVVVVVIVLHSCYGVWICECKMPIYFRSVVYNGHIYVREHMTGNATWTMPSFV